MYQLQTMIFLQSVLVWTLTKLSSHNLATGSYFSYDYWYILGHLHHDEMGTGQFNGSCHIQHIQHKDNGLKKKIGSLKKQPKNLLGKHIVLKSLCVCDSF